MLVAMDYCHIHVTLRLKLYTDLMFFVAIVSV